jgi:hypothetical protein
VLAFTFNHEDRPPQSPPLLFCSSSIVPSDIADKLRCCPCRLCSTSSDRCQSTAVVVSGGLQGSGKFLFWATKSEHLLSSTAFSRERISAARSSRFPPQSFKEVGLSPETKGPTPVGLISYSVFELTGRRRKAYTQWLQPQAASRTQKS